MNSKTNEWTLTPMKPLRTETDPATGNVWSYWPDGTRTRPAVPEDLDRGLVRDIVRKGRCPDAQSAGAEGTGRRLVKAAR